MGALGGGGEPTASFTQMFWFICVSCIGPGALAIPSFIPINGLGPFIMMNLILGFCTVWSMLCLNRVKMHVEAKHDLKIEMYQDIGQLLFGDVGRRCVEFFVVGVQFGVLCVKFSTITIILEAVFPNLGLARTELVFALIPIIIALCLLRFLRDLGNLASWIAAAFMGALAWTLVVCLQQVSQEVKNTALFTDNYLQLFGLYGALVYVWEGLPAVLCQVANVLAEKERTADLVLASMGTVFAIASTTGVLGALAFRNPQNPITVSLIEENGRGFGPIAVNVIIALVQFVRYPMQLFPITSLLERNLGFGPGSLLSLSVNAGEASVATPLLLGVPKIMTVETDVESESVCITPDDEGSAKTIAMRVAIIILSALAFLAVPNLNDLISLVGLAFGSALGIVLPATFDVRCAMLDGPSYKRSKAQVAVSATIALLVSLVAAVGLVVLVTQIFFLGIEQPV